MGNKFTRSLHTSRKSENIQVRPPSWSSSTPVYDCLNLTDETQRLISILQNTDHKQLDRFSLGGLFVPIKVFSVYDGDTLNALIPVNFAELEKVSHQKQRPKRTLKSVIVFTPGTVVMSYPIRLFGLDARELHDEGGKEARQILLDTIGGEEAMLQANLYHFDKYGRLLADLYLLDGTSINKLLVTKYKKYFLEYDGKKKEVFDKL
jgi:endonuclease YncB( thermonuclease family)